MYVDLVQCKVTTQLLHIKHRFSDKTKVEFVWIVLLVTQFVLNGHNNKLHGVTSNRMLILKNSILHIAATW